MCTNKWIICKRNRTYRQFLCIRNGTGGATVSDNSISGNTISGNTVSDNVISEETASGNTVSGNDVTDESVSGNTVSGNDVSEENESDESVSDNEGIEDTSEETVSDNNPVEPVVSGNTVSCNEPDEKVVIDHDMEGSLSKKPSRPEIYLYSILDGREFLLENNEKYTVVSEKIDYAIKASSDCKIYYSTNGKNPTFKNGLPSANAQLYTSKKTISFEKKTVIKAIAVNAAGICSPVTTATIMLKIPLGGHTVSATGSTISNGKVSVNVTRGKKFKINVIPENANYAPEFLKKINFLKKSEPQNAGNSVKVVYDTGLVTVSKDAKLGQYVISSFKTLGYDGDVDIIVNVVESPTITSLKTKKKTVELTTIGTTATSYNIFNDIEYKATKTLKGTDFVWESSDKSIATVSTAGVVKTVPGVKGKTTIIATAKDGSMKSVKFTVKVNQQSTKVEITGSSKVGLGKSIQLKANVYPLNVANAKVKWEMVDAVDNSVKINSKGKLTVSKKANKGSYTVKATTLDGSNKSDTFTVNVDDAIERFMIFENSITLYRVKGNNNISATTTESIAVAAVSTGGALLDDMEIINNMPGLVTAKYDGMLTVTATGNGTGTATITCRATDGSGKKTTVKVKVVNPPSSIDIKLPNGSTGDLASGKKYKPDVILGTAYGNPGNVKVKWSFSQALPGMTINENTGEIKVASDVPAGNKAKITASVQGNLSLTKTITVTVTKPILKMDLQYEDNLVGNKKIELKIDEAKKVRVMIKNDSYSWTKFHEASETSDITKQFSITSNKSDLEITKYDSKNIIATIKGKKAGTYKITVKALDGTGKKKTFTVKVK